MATLLSTPIHRETSKVIQHRAVIITLAPSGSQSEALIGFRLKGTRQSYICAVSDLYAWAAEQHGYKLKAAKRQARKDGISWKWARKNFNEANRL